MLFLLLYKSTEKYETYRREILNLFQSYVILSWSEENNPAVTICWWLIFHITSGQINTLKGVNQLKELFVFKLNYSLNIWIWNWQIIGILLLKTHYFSQFITKMGFGCRILSLNDLTPTPISWSGTHCLRCQRANARANLWWHEPFPGETSITLRLCWTSGDRKMSCWW